MRDHVAEELPRLYVPFATQLAALLGRTETIDAEVRRVMSAKPVHSPLANGDGRDLLPVKLHARGVSNLGHSQSIANDLRLPAWEAGVPPIWPRLERAEAERRAAMPMPANSDWGEQWEKEAAARAARARP